MRRKPVKVVDGVALYQCSKCRKYIPEGGFYRDVRAANGLCGTCKVCVAGHGMKNDGGMAALIRRRRARLDAENRSDT